MLEILETATIGAQAAEMLAEKTVSDVAVAASPHKFAWYNGDPQNYPELLVGHTVAGVTGHGTLIRITGEVWKKFRHRRPASTVRS